MYHDVINLFNQSSADMVMLSQANCLPHNGGLVLLLRHEKPPHNPPRHDALLHPMLDSALRSH